jgi:hypothetical protein
MEMFWREAKPLIEQDKLNCVQKLLMPASLKTQGAFDKERESLEYQIDRAVDIEMQTSNICFICFDS